MGGGMPHLLKRRAECDCRSSDGMGEQGGGGVSVNKRREMCRGAGECWASFTLVQSMTEVIVQFVCSFVGFPPNLSSAFVSVR